jgi:hypothetical protein
VEEDLAALDPCHADRVHEDVVAWTIRSRVEQGLMLPRSGGHMNA